MDYLYQDLLDSLKTGYVDSSHKSRNDLLPRLLTNNKEVGVKVLTTIIAELKACDRFWFSVAFVTNSGVQTLIQTLKELEDSDVKGEILVSQYLNFTQPEALRRLLKFKNIKLRINTIGSFHSKGYLFRKSNSYNLIIGSSNLTADALCSNKEMNLKVSAAPKSYLVERALNEFSSEFENSFVVDEEFICQYEEVYKRANQGRYLLAESQEARIAPNLMQLDALKNLAELRKNNKNKALLISATGTGKTFLSAFDAQKINAKKLLFVVHRENIARSAMSAFRKIFGGKKTYGLFTGNKKELDSDFVFSTIQSISKSESLDQFSPEYFDYIVIDESHRAGAKSYHSVLNYFRPKFLLGMTATPERTDGEDIFSLYDHNIAYEIRLQRALEENLLSPFHYFGVTDLLVNGNEISEVTEFKNLVSHERVERIIEKINLYSVDSGVIRGLVFCSRNEEAGELSRLFNLRGYKTIALSGSSSEIERLEAISRIESEDESIRIDYVFSVDIFNEGIDIPKINQVVMLRPTQSAIIFVQQLGRGLRKAAGKDYLTVIDFIGNYANNFMIPIALYGDSSYNKDSLRKLVASGSNLMPGESTINFDRIAKERIYASIDAARFQLSKDLAKDYDVLKFKIGRTPMMMDFAKLGSRDPFLYVEKHGSYFNYVAYKEKESGLAFNLAIDKPILKLFQLMSSEINNSKRVEESILLQMLLNEDRVSEVDFINIVESKYGFIPNHVQINSYVHNLNMLFVTEASAGKMVPSGDLHSFNVCSHANGIFSRENSLTMMLQVDVLSRFLKDSTEYAIYAYDKHFKINNFNNGFIKYQKYSRKDVFRILNWYINPVAQNVGGYIFNADKTQCPIFVNYHKDDDISSTTKYEDKFVNNFEFEWMSKSNRKLSSPEIIQFQKYDKKLRLPLFIKKSNDEGSDFYYMGELSPISDSFEQKFMINDTGGEVPVVKVRFLISPAVEESMFNYLEEK